MPSFVPTSIFPVLRALASRRGQKVFLVGGALRDAYLQRPGCDLDFAVSGGAIDLARRFAKAVKGAFVLLDEESGCARVVRKVAGRPWTYDFADLRAKTLKGDLARRDFTVNTLAVDISYCGDTYEIKGQFRTCPRKYYAHPKALSDLKAGIIRMAGPRAFSDDPLRLLRAYSLQAQLGFRIERVTRARIKAHKALIRKVSVERVREELFKILSSARAAAVIRDMDRDGLLFEVMPQVRVMYGVKQGGYHHLDVWKHSLEVLSQLEALLKEKALHREVPSYLAESLGGGHARLAVLKLACLLHDIGKPDTKKKEASGRTTFHTHEHAGRRIARIIARQLMLSTRERHALEDMVMYHLRPGYLSNFKRPSDKAVFRYFRDTRDEAVSILLLSLADQRSTRGPLTTARDIKHHQEICWPLIARYFSKKEEKPFVRILTGHDLIHSLGLKPGPDFAKILARVEEAQHLGKVTTKKEALDLVRKMGDL